MKYTFTDENHIYCAGVGTPSVIINGVVLDNLLKLEEDLLETIQAQTPKLQRAVYLGEVNDKTNILG